MAIHLEDVIEETGGCGRYQVILSLIIHCCKLIPCFGLKFMMIGNKVPDWWCVDSFPDSNVLQSVLTSNSTGYKSCINNNGTTCQKFVFDKLGTSIVPQWELVCDNDWIPATIMSVQMAGVFIGNIAGGHIADLIGRKPPFYVAIAVTSMSMAVAIFSASWIMFTVIRFFIGMSIGVHLTVMYSSQSEFVLPRWRAWIVALPSWHIALILFALTSWGLGDWKYIHVASAAVGGVCLLTCWFVPESFRWKVAHGHMEDASKIIKFVSKINKRSAPSDEALGELARSIRRTNTHKTRKYTIVDLVKSRTILKNSVLLLIVWLTLGLGTYGIQFGVQALSGSVYVNICIVSAINIPLQFVIIYLQNRFGRKKTIILHYTVFAVGAFCVGIIDQLEESDTNRAVSRGFALVALIAIGVVWSPVQTHTLELYPTVIRNIGYGLQNTMARLGAVIGPQLAFLDTRFPGTMYFVCAGLGLLATLVILPLPETEGTDLQDNLPDRQITIDQDDKEISLERNGERNSLEQISLVDSQDSVEKMELANKHQQYDPAVIA